MLYVIAFHLQNFRTFLSLTITLFSNDTLLIVTSNCTLIKLELYFYHIVTFNYPQPCNTNKRLWNY